jgi:hypothetical protein
MAVETSTGSGLDLNSLLQSAIAGGSRGNILGGDKGSDEFLFHH